MPPMMIAIIRSSILMWSPVALRQNRTVSVSPARRHRVSSVAFVDEGAPNRLGDDAVAGLRRMNIAHGLIDHVWIEQSRLAGIAAEGRLGRYVLERGEHVGHNRPIRLGRCGNCGIQIR